MTSRDRSQSTPSVPEASADVLGEPGILNRSRPLFGLLAGGHVAFYSLAAVLILFSLMIHFERMSSVGLVNSDDMFADLDAAHVKAEGWPAYWHYASSQAIGQARIGFIPSIFVFIAPYFLDQPARAVVITLVHFLSIAALCSFLAVYAGMEIGVLCLCLCYALLPHWWHYFPIASYPLEFHSAILLFFGAALFRIIAIRMKRLGMLPRFLTGFSMLCLLFSLCVYEPLTLAFAV